jgi:hypothetical protein
MEYQGQNYVEKPGKVQAIAIMTLINGILDVLWGVGLTISVILGTWGLGLFCAPLTILPSVLGIFEIIYASKLLGNPPRKYPVQTIAILQIIAIIYLDFIGPVIGILSLVFYSDPPVKQFIESLPE